MPDVLYEEVVEVDEEVILPLGAEPDRWAAPDWLSAATAALSESTHG